MINTKKLATMAKNMVGISRKRISNPSSMNASSSSSPPSIMANKGCFVVYTTDQKRFTIPIKYLSVKVFQELFRMSEEEFGLPSEGPIKMPCDSKSMEYIISLVQKGLLTKRLEKDVINSMMAISYCSSFDTSSNCSSSATSHQPLVASAY